MDFSAGTMNLVLGYGHAALENAATQQAHTGVDFHSSRFHSAAYIECARRLSVLVSHLPVVHHKVCSGSDANETAIKIARKSTGRRLIATQLESHLGETCETHSASGRDVGLKATIQGSSDFVHFPPPTGDAGVDFELASRALEPFRGKLAGILIEPVPLRAGLLVFPSTAKYLTLLRTLADDHKALLLFDEVQTFGWTDSILATNHFGAFPDVVALAKGVGFGHSLAAVLMKKELRDVLDYNEAELTFGANPIACAVCAQGMQILCAKDFQIERKGALLAFHLRRLAAKYGRIATCRRFGLILSISFNGANDEERSFFADEFYRIARERGLLLRRTGNSVVFKPPIIVTDQQVASAVRIVEDTLQELEASI